MYPAYPRHSFSLRGLVHICIPHTGTPCGRVLGNRSYSLSWAFPFGIAVPSPFVSLLYHRGSGLSRPFSNFFQVFFILTLSVRLATLPWDNYSIANGCPNCNRQNTQITGFLHPHLCALYILTKLLAAWYNGNSAQDARPRAANYSTLFALCQA